MLRSICRARSMVAADAFAVDPLSRGGCGSYSISSCTDFATLPPPSADLDFLPSNVHVTAIDVTPAMLKHLERRAAGMARSVTARMMDARQLAFSDSSFDAVVMHLILAVMPEPERGLSEAVRVLKPSGRIAVFDKFLRDEERASLKRRLLNAMAKPLFSDP
jgi:phosphatidylethanolamine/phosphatidyl-N-methylethanolamine N-methyltransferase